MKVSAEYDISHQSMMMMMMAPISSIEHLLQASMLCCHYGLHIEVLDYLERSRVSKYVCWIHPKNINLRYLVYE